VRDLTLTVQDGVMGSALIGPLPARHRRPELMDQPELDADAHVLALRGLGRINRVSRSDAILWPSLAGLAAENRGGPIHVLDLACGGGDVVMALARRGARAGLDIRLEGCDLSPVAVAYASRKAAVAGVPVRFFPLDILDQPIPRCYHVVTCSLFLHHLGEDQAVMLLRQMAEAAGELVLVSDLIRSRTGQLLARVGCPLLSRSPIVHHDGLVSVGAAFRLAEAADLARRAGLSGARLTRHWPQRFLLSWSRRWS
jgi:2-polyprenyl-3-methyl-5-hydroxy-6-metoxy-1,4-benzoquinol methylase